MALLGASLAVLQSTLQDKTLSESHCSKWLKQAVHLIEATGGQLDDVGALLPRVGRVEDGHCWQLEPPVYQRWAAPQSLQ